MIERFCKKLNCAPSHGLNTHPGVSMSRDEDDRSIAFLFSQLGLQLQTRHLRHADVNDQTRSLTMQIRFEEIFRASERPCHKPGRLHKVAQRILHGVIVINDRNQFGLLVRQHALKSNAMAPPGAIKLWADKTRL